MHSHKDPTSHEQVCTEYACCVYVLRKNETDCETDKKRLPRQSTLIAGRIRQLQVHALQAYLHARRHAYTHKYIERNGAHIHAYTQQVKRKYIKRSELRLCQLRHKP